MARVRPFRAWRYSSSAEDISSRVAPPYDVIDEVMRRALVVQDPHNVVELELPEGPLDPSVPGNRYENAQVAWDAWRHAGILCQDELPSVYVLEQRFKLDGRAVRRRAFIVEVGLEPFDKGIVLPHERTLPKALGDRYEMIKATRANLSQVFGLYDDPEQATDDIFETVSTGEPVASAVDADGVTSILWASSDGAIAARLSQFMADKQIFIADGHHRYTTALAYRDHKRQLSGFKGDSDAPSESVMMALVNMDDPDLEVLAYNRIADGIDFDPAAFKAALCEHFTVSELGPGHPLASLEGLDRPAFLVQTRADERPYLAELKDSIDLDETIGLPQSTAWKSLDVAVLQELILWPLLGIHPDRPETLDRLSFTKNAHDAFAATATHDVAFALRPTRLSQLRDVSLAGEIMPQKSTYFYPKVLSGLIFRSAE